MRSGAPVGTRAGASDRGFGACSRRCRCRSQEQFEPEHASHADRAFDADHAFHQFDHPLAHHEADARAFLGAALLSETVERLKELRQLFRRQSRAGVCDADANAFRTGDGARHLDRSPLAVVFDRVGKQVDEDLLHPGPIGIDKERDVELGKGHADATLLRLRLHHGLAFGHDLGQRRGFRRHRQLPGFDHREIEDFVDQLEQMPTRLENMADACPSGRPSATGRMTPAVGRNRGSR